MGFADDLLEQAKHLLNKDGNAPKQASLQRAISTAYYALFSELQKKRHVADYDNSTVWTKANTETWVGQGQ